MTFHDLKWPWRHDEGSPVTIFRLRMSILPVTRCLRVLWMVFVQKRPFIFLPLTYNGEVAKLTDLRSPISKFRDIRFIDTGTNINGWKLQGDRSFGVAMANIQSFSEVVIWRDLVTWPWVIWVQNFHKVCRKDVWSFTKNDGAPRAVFQLSAKNLRGVTKHPPGPVRVKISQQYLILLFKLKHRFSRTIFGISSYF